MLRHCSAVNTRLPSEASAKDGLKDFLRALGDILRQAQDERGLKTSLGIGSKTYLLAL